MAGDVVVRIAQPGDVEAITQLVRAAYTPYIGRIGRHPAPMNADYPHVVAAGHTWVAHLDNQLVGVLVLEPADDHLLIENVAVAPESQEVGVGGRLLALAEEEARRLGVPEVRIYTNVAMTENLAYYPRRGYRETHRATSDGYARVYFTKQVSEEG